MEGDGKPSAAVSTCEASCYEETFCLLSLSLGCLAVAIEREILQITGNAVLPGEAVLRRCFTMML